MSRSRVGLACRVFSCFHQSSQPSRRDSGTSLAHCRNGLSGTQSLKKWFKKIPSPTVSSALSNSYILYVCGDPLGAGGTLSLRRKQAGPEQVQGWVKRKTPISPYHQCPRDIRQANGITPHLRPLCSSFPRWCWELLNSPKVGSAAFPTG